MAPVLLYPTLMIDEERLQAVRGPESGGQLPIQHLIAII